MVRVVLGGPEAEGLVSLVPDEHVKLVFPDEDGSTRPPTLADDGETVVWPRPVPPFREYTIRRLGAGEVWIDFVVHPGGLASDWAQAAEPGDSLWVVGPRSSLETTPAADTLVLLADHTALPAVARWLEELAPGTRAEVAVLVPDADEEQQLVVRPGVAVTWLHQDDPEVAAAGVDVLGRHLDSLTLPADGTTFLWAAGEAGVLKPIRRLRARDLRHCGLLAPGAHVLGAHLSPLTRCRRWLAGRPRRRR